LKAKDTNIVSETELLRILKEKGLTLDPRRLYYIPYGPNGYSNQEGLMVDGKLKDVAYYNLENTIKHITELDTFDLPGKLKQRGIEVNKDDLFHLPFTAVDGRYVYDIEQVIAYLNSVNRYNLSSKLKERGCELNEEQLQYARHHLDDYKNGYSSYDLDKIIAFFNSVTDYNLIEKIEELGYEISDDELLKMEIHQPPLSVYKDGITTWHWELVKKYLKKNPPKNKVKPMNPKTTDDNLFGSDPKEFFEPSASIFQSFPMSKWYTTKFNTVPDICYVGCLEIWSLLRKKDYSKIIWCSKALSYLPDSYDYSFPDMLRTFSNEELVENLKEALIEIESGMYLYMVNGHFRYNDKGTDMNANVYLVYKEGIHDTTDTIKYLSEFYVQHDESGTLGLLYHDGRNFGTHDFVIPKPEIDFNLHYNEGFQKVHSNIYSSLLKQKGKGLVLLHGKPGTGKTSYIRYLINLLNKNKIFVPPNLTGMLSDPTFIPFLMDNTDCVLFVEDAEDVLRRREDGINNQAVSNILNITDGLLSDCLNIQIVATFNTHLKNIDEALLRKGRLIEQYEFKELEPTRAEKLGDHLKVWLDDTSHLTLADIYSAKLKTK
jgi:hypothetical protein